jgi:RNA polymerase sigma factor (sigma-70 family)
MNNPRSDLQPRHTQVKDEALFLANLPVIDAAIRQVCRRHHLAAAEADDFASEVRLHFIERNYEPLRRFEGRSSLRSYLIVVVQHLFLDYRNRLWGKWRPSAEAKRQGPLAMLVERLVTRDGWTVEQAVEILRTNHSVEVTEAHRALYVKLTQRAPGRQFVAEVEADGVESASPAPDANVLRAEHDFRAKRVQTALDRVRQTLSPTERLILKMRFEDSIAVADIARALHLNQKRLYRTIEQLLTTLREGLEAEGIGGGEAAALFADGIDIESSETQQRAGDAGNPQPAERARAPWRKS